MAITLAQIVDAIEDTLDAATTLATSQTYDELTEGMQDTPTLQVYPESNEQVSADSGTDRRTFGGKGGVENKPVREKVYVIHADYYARQRSHMGEDMTALVDGIDAMEDVLEDEDTGPFFGLDGIKALTWSWSRVTFIYGDEMIRYVGARFIIRVWVF